MKSKIVLTCILLCVLLFSCNHTKTMEKDGGVKVSLSLNYSDFFKTLSENSDANELEKIINEMKTIQVKDFSEFVIAFQKTGEKLFPETKFAPMFPKLIWKGKINENSSNEEVLKKLKTEWDSALTQTIFIIKKRLDKAVTENAIVKIKNGNNLIVEIPGDTNTIRIQNLLTTTGELGFWETYKIEKIFPYLNQVNDYLVKNKYQCQVKEKTDLPEPKIDSVGAKSPLFFVLRPSVSPEGGFQNSCLIGYVLTSDTSEVNKIFSIKDVQKFFPSNCKFSWTFLKQRGDQSYFEFIALKTSRSGGPMLDNNVIAKAEAKKDNSGNVILLEMNNEGARIWKRMTAENINNQIAITTDNSVCTYPTVINQIESGKSSISGNFTADEAKDLAAVLNSGKYPVNLFAVKSELIQPKK